MGTCRDQATGGSHAECNASSHNINREVISQLHAPGAYNVLMTLRRSKRATRIAVALAIGSMHLVAYSSQTLRNDFVRGRSLVSLLDFTLTVWLQTSSSAAIADDEIFLSANFDIDPAPYSNAGLSPALNPKYYNADARNISREARPNSREGAAAASPSACGDRCVLPACCCRPCRS